MELTESVREVVESAMEELKGAARRRFMAEIVLKLGKGGQRKAAREFGWGRNTIRKGGARVAHGYRMR